MTDVNRLQERLDGELLGCDGCSLRKIAQDAIDNLSSARSLLENVQTERDALRIQLEDVTKERDEARAAVEEHEALIHIAKRSEEGYFGQLETMQKIVDEWQSRAENAALKGRFEEGVEVWQPIKTAPKDSTRLLGWYGGNVHFIYFHPDALQWMIPGVRLPITPTHWMPLPDPPESCRKARIIPEGQS